MTSLRTASLSPSATPLSPRQEVFCHSYVYFPNASNAAREAGYEAASARQQGHRLLRIPAIAARVAAIRRGMAEDGCRETGVLLGKLENIYNRAIEDRHYVAAARTVEIQARLAGLMPSVNERLRASGDNEPPAAAPTMDEPQGGDK
ncbi:MAG: terminase small subunit [Rhodospirillales bacterium]|nr:terminase small subunit [Rhodospirillales bacterium]